MKKIRLINLIILIVVGLLILNLVALFNFIKRKETQPILFNQEKNLKVIFFDIGQGDAILIITPDREKILIDGGPDKSIIYKLDQYLPFYERKIDLMILTHPDPDHLTGLVEVLKRYQVNKVFYNGVDDENLVYKEFLKIIDEKGIKKEIVWFNKQIILNCCQIYFLYPFENLAGKDLKNDNEGSLIFKFIFTQRKILFTGDATKNVEKNLINYKIDLKSDILKVAHHGSKDSTSQEFLGKVKPIYAVISVGKNNKFGHPNLRVLKNLEKIGAKILRTDKLGDIIFEINEISLNYKSVK